MQQKNYLYFARPLNRSETDLDMGRFGRMGVFKRSEGKDELLGSYIRNYGTAFNTFFPFELNGKELALYSPDYTATRIMELPSCNDLGGEEPDDIGFCPVDYFVPTYVDLETVHETDNKELPPRRISKSRVNNPHESLLSVRTEQHTYTNGNTGQLCTDTMTHRPSTAPLFYPFGFVAGCIWGDDSSWKIQYLDLSEADKGILKRDDRFGYIMLPENQSLKDAIDMYDYGYDDEDDVAYQVRINISQPFDLRTGKAVNPLD